MRRSEDKCGICVYNCPGGCIHITSSLIPQGLLSHCLALSWVSLEWRAPAESRRPLPLLASTDPRPCPCASPLPAPRSTCRRGVDKV